MGRVKRCVSKLEHKISQKLSVTLLSGGTGYHQLMQAFDFSSLIFYAVTCICHWSPNYTNLLPPLLFFLLNRLPLYHYQAGSSTYPSLNLYSFEAKLLLMTAVQSCDSLLRTPSPTSGDNIDSIAMLLCANTEFGPLWFHPNKRILCFDLWDLTLGLLRMLFFGNWICTSPQDKMYSLTWCATNKG